MSNAPVHMATIFNAGFGGPLIDIACSKKKWEPIAKDMDPNNYSSDWSKVTCPDCQLHQNKEPTP